MNKCRRILGKDVTVVYYKTPKEDIMLPIFFAGGTPFYLLFPLTVPLMSFQGRYKIFEINSGCYRRLRVYDNLDKTSPTFTPFDFSLVSFFNVLVLTKKDTFYTSRKKISTF